MNSAHANVRHTAPYEEALPSAALPLRVGLVSAVVLTFFLTGCGAGGGAGGDAPSFGAAGPGDGFTEEDRSELPGDVDGQPVDEIDPEVVPLVQLPWGDFGPFDDLADAARSDYGGPTEQAVLDATASGVLVDTLLFGPFAHDQLSWNDYRSGRFSPLDLLQTRVWAESSVTAGSHGLSERRGCVAGGHLTEAFLDPDENDRDVAVKALVYENCDDGQSVVDGRLALSIEYEEDTTTSTTYFGFDELTLSQGSTAVVVSGAERWKRTNSGECEKGDVRTSTLLVREPAGGREILLDELRTSPVFEESFPYHCDSETYGIRSNIGSVRGRLLHSEFGMIEVTTSTPIHHRIDPLDGWLRDTDEDGDSDDGRIDLVGADGGHASFSYESTGLEPSYGDIRHIDVLAELRTTMGSGEDERTLRLTIDSFLDGALLDADKGEKIGTDPARSIDESVRVSIESVVDHEGVQSVHARVHVAGADSDVRAKVGRVELDLGGDARWDETALPPRCTPSASDERALRCEFEPGYGEWERVFEVPLVIGTENELRVEARAASSLVDRAPLDNVAVASHDYRIVPPVDFAVDAPAFAFGDAEAAKRLAANVTQSASAAHADVVVTVEVPSGLLVEAAELLSSGGQSLVSRCTVGADVVCRMEEVRQGETLALELDYLAVREGMHELRWAVTSEAEDGVPANDTATTRVKFVRSSASLQALIDAALDGGTVTLPAGVYSGTLNGGGREIEVRGADGAEPTVLVSIDPDQPLIRNTGSYSVWRGFELRTTGALVAKSIGTNTSFLDNVIAPFEGMPHAVDPLFDAMGSYRLEGNRLVGWGEGESGACGTLLDVGASGQYGGDVYLRHNVFLRNDCERVLLIQTEWGVHVTNNTFVGNPKLALVQNSGVDFRSAQLDFLSNIVVGADSVLDVDDGLYDDKFGGRLTSSRNIVRDSERASILSGDLVSRPAIVVERTDLGVEPLFVDAASDDYRPAAGSPVIDAGVDPGTYDWAWTHEGVLPGFDHWRQPPAGTERTPVDGDGDGRAVFDIGAFEYEP